VVVVCRGSFVVYDFLSPNISIDGCGWAAGTFEEVSNLGPDVRYFDCYPPDEVLDVGGKCTSLIGDLTLISTQGRDMTLGASQLGSYLDRLGLNDLIQIEGRLIVDNQGTLKSIDLPFGDVVFLPKLKRVSILRLSDKNPSMGAPAIFSKLGGFANLEQTDYLQIFNQNLPDFSSFRGLKCVNFGMFVDNNTAITSFTGLENLLGVGLSPGSSEIPLVVIGSPILTILSALSEVAGCQGVGVGSIATQLLYISIPLQSCVIVSWSSLCLYIQTGKCTKTQY
jgi:hypothetical protein